MTAVAGRLALTRLRDGHGLCLLAAIVLLVGAAPETLAFRLNSYAIINDDGSLSIRNHTIRLFGLAIPPTGRTCRTFERPVVCGSLASLALDFKIDNNFVDCETQGENPDGSLVAICRVNGEDLGAWMIAQGWARVLPGAPDEYGELETIARRNGLGIWGWQSTFPLP
jgi:endonuclease YncB( thermonuclease family)